MAKSYRLHFRKVKDVAFYIKDNYEYYAVCNSKYNSHDTNLLSRIRNTIATGINKKEKLPKYIIITLDSDLIDFLEYANYGVSTLYRQWLEWIINEVDLMI